ncbi:hypothetical protein Afil01_62020 [Actinorhabdospora filicis]|uniref:Uncharacterized protein n=1 Tax=Actinorhabdospora filicis TaxID=1785913 RepID=A0A9W6WE08_9ACTN|nr:hypothetical protein [Actinorhabdospora filicis]GLZ81395.1 hypothetical protein Afil01_62020 [Actinorhabdospora filicis]
MPTEIIHTVLGRKTYLYPSRSGRRWEVWACNVDDSPGEVGEVLRKGDIWISYLYRIIGDPGAINDGPDPESLALELADVAIRSGNV